MGRRSEDSDDDDLEQEVDMTPMLDIVFILLIFFIVTSTFVKESGIEVNKPGAVTAERKERASILVAIDADNRVWVDKRKVDVRAVRAHIERLRAENPQGGVVIQADEESKNKLLVKVMDAARQAGVEDIALAADPESGG
ncbi:MAG: biopolymer transporter ExbD [Myxococcota bacterium]